jgi:thiol-disulfide isomerase/thioredoxin
MQLTLYGRAGCHLCHDMAQELAPIADAYRARIVEIDVDSDPELELRYGERVPVLLGPAGEEICHYFLDVAALRSALEKSAPPRGLG